MIEHSKKIILLLLIFNFSCTEREDQHLDSSLSISLTTSEDEITVGNELIISFDVKNADSLFALSFSLKYDSNKLSANESIDIISVGNLFSDPFPNNIPMFLLEGEVSTAIGENGIIQKTSSGNVCTITFIAIGVGTASIFINSLDMIKSDGSSIDGFNANNLIAAPIEVNVINN